MATSVIRLWCKKRKTEVRSQKGRLNWRTRKPVNLLTIKEGTKIKEALSVGMIYGHLMKPVNSEEAEKLRATLFSGNYLATGSKMVAEREKP